MKRYYVKAVLRAVTMETEQHLLSSSTPDEEWGDEFGYIQVGKNDNMNKLA
jgi:hypothetical protein